eukprot:CAMPEP_0204250290 /NCGR_PEP_ID=MMETSP0361-20130328/100091_1 /ASSEMBLY_ACC=CAM_ASM_000343 /TAXON_ID=268821 /ORGANISM="Scrippsiella Hangoei, Strain SHTV-5" /LENGTH=330 /DNA_ID=CAMNT_0051223559 /DNA_START=48 /DNA_END=1037 /DNA_ORIENTATION=-
MARFMVVPFLEPECDETEHAPISREVRSAHRHAAVELAVSGLVFVAALSLILFALAHDRAVTSGVAGSSIGLGQVARAPVPEGSFAMFKESKQTLTTAVESLNHMGEDLVLSRYRLVSPATLRRNIGITARAIQELPTGTQVFPLKNSMDWVQVIVPKGEGAAPAIQELPTGTQVFPLKNSMDWVQVIVPKGEGANGVQAAFGWLPVKEHGAKLLQKEVAMPSDMRQRRTVTQEERSKQWDEVRAKNAELKNSQSHLQDSMRARFVNKMMLSKQHQAAGAMPVGHAPASAASGVTAAGTTSASLVAQRGPGVIVSAPSSTSSAPEQPADM